MKHLFIINPAAGSRDRTARYTQQIETICKEKDLAYEIRVSSAPGDCTRIAREAAQTGQDYHIYSCGGDGTLNEVVAGVAGYDNVAITMFAGGSGNDFIKIFNETEPFRDLERLLDCEEATFDLLKCNDDISLNICSVGFDARIAADVSRYKRLPLLSGFRAYAVSAAMNIMKGISEHYVIEIDGEQIDGKQTLMCACNGRYYGGGFNPVPEADLQDGKMDVLLVRGVSRLKVLKIIGKYKNGQYAKYPDLIRHFRTDRIKLIFDKPTSINLDGEIRTATEADISIAKEKLRFFYPKGLTFSAKAPVHM